MSDSPEVIVACTHQRSEPLAHRQARFRPKSASADSLGAFHVTETTRKVGLWRQLIDSRAQLP